MVRPGVPAAAAAATDMAGRTLLRGLLLAGLLLGSLLQFAAAQVLPDDRFDVLYHFYDGGGQTIQGPSILARKQIGASVSVSASYNVDSISGASIDVVTQASPYTETRREIGAGIDYLRNNTILSFNYTNSDENDYTANTFGLNISQEIFGGMTTVSMGYVRGFDEVGRSDNPDFSADIDRHSWRLGLTQVVTRNLIAEIAFETISDEGFLNLPYRQVRYVDPDSATGFSWEPEVYPNTRTSNAVALRSRLHLPYRGAVQTDYRYYEDTWGIKAHSAEVGYTHGALDRWTFDVGYRYYRQSGADFFSDLFPFREAQNFRGRWKEISAFDSHALRLGVSYELLKERLGFVERSVIGLSFERILYDYSDFRDVRVEAEPGDEPTYSFQANVMQFMFSVWF